MKTLPPGLLSIEEIAEKFRLSRSFFYQASSRRDIGTFKIGRRLYFDPREVEGWIAGKARREAVR
jgi:excisionase family DNA binding protein